MVKWKGRPVEDSSWLAREEVNRLGFPPNTLDMIESLLKLPQVSNVGASWVYEQSYITQKYFIFILFYFNKD